MTSDGDDAYEALIQFLYQAPVGLIQLQQDGSIEMLNPMASQLLMPVSPDGNLANLFDVLQQQAPGLRAQCQAYPGAHGVIADGMRLVLGAAHAAEPGGRGGRPEVLALGVLKVDAGRMMAVLVDATAEVQREQRTLARRLDSAARIDTLTKLPNRAAVRELLQRMAARPRAASGDEGALLFINVDRFRQVNHTLGSPVGDQVMVLMAERLRASVRSGARPGGDGSAQGLGEVAARVGGDEFTLVLDGLAGAGVAESIAARLQQTLGKPYRIGLHDISLQFSIGVVYLGAGGAAADDVLRDASVAVAVAKAAGGGQTVLFQPAMREQAARRGGIEAELRSALAQGQLFTVYQPVVGVLPDGAIDRSAGVEALVRWQHPARGVVGPIEFIEIAEQSGLIDAIGEFVLRAACRDFAAWQSELGPRAPRLLAVNLSRAQLGDASLCDKVAAILAASGMQPAQLQLEVTESLAAQGADIQQQLQRLKALGVKLALDDFGTGYSSLSSLHLLPVDTVKIDRSFVSLSDTSHHHEVLIEATVKVARSLGMSTVAEGIETEAQAAVVRRQGCDKGQGYLYSRPLPAAALAAWIQAP